MTGLLQDIRYALRQLGKSPGFTSVAVFTLSLGIGATTAMFSLVDGALFRSLRYPHADRLVSVGVMAPIIDGEFLLQAIISTWRRSKLHSPASPLPPESPIVILPIPPCPVDLRGGGIHLPAHVRYTTSLGRNFTPEEDSPNRPEWLALAMDSGRAASGGDPGIVDRTLSLDGKASPNSGGVLPRDFEFPTLLAHIGLVVPRRWMSPCVSVI